MPAGRRVAPLVSRPTGTPPGATLGEPAAAAATPSGLPGVEAPSSSSHPAKATPKHDVSVSTATTPSLPEPEFWFTAGADTAQQKSFTAGGDTARQKSQKKKPAAKPVSEQALDIKGVSIWWCVIRGREHSIGSASRWRRPYCPRHADPPCH